MISVKKKKLKNIVFNRSATVKLSEAGGVSKWYYDQIKVLSEQTRELNK